MQVNCTISQQAALQVESNEYMMLALKADASVRRSSSRSPWLLHILSSCCRRTGVSFQTGLKTNKLSVSIQSQVPGKMVRGRKARITSIGRKKRRTLDLVHLHRSPLPQHSSSLFLLSNQTQASDLLSLGGVLSWVGSLGLAVGGLHLHCAESLYQDLTVSQFL